MLTGKQMARAAHNYREVQLVGELDGKHDIFGEWKSIGLTVIPQLGVVKICFPCFCGYIFKSLPLYLQIFMLSYDTLLFLAGILVISYRSQWCLSSTVKAVM